MVTRMQVTLDDDQHRRAKQKADSDGVSLAEYIRRLVATDLGEGRAPADISAVFNLGGSGGSDVSRHKDDYIGEAVEALHPRRGRPST